MPSPPAPGRPAVDASATDRQAGRGERILIVEDDYFVALSIESALEEAGYQVIAVVSSGEKAVETAIASRPALTLMDIRLAGDMDGIEAACELLRMGIRCIFASAHSDEGTRQRGTAAEPLGWLTKPFTQEELLGAVRGGLAHLRQK